MPHNRCLHYENLVNTANVEIETIRVHISTVPGQKKRRQIHFEDF